MPETITSWWFWLFMFLRLVWVNQAGDESSAWEKRFPVPDVPSSLSEVFQSYTAIIVTGGSSGLGRAFIRNALNLHPAVSICNLSRNAPEIFSGEKGLHHISCDLAREADVEHAAGQLEAWLQGAPSGRVLLINNSGFGAYGPFPEPNLSRHLEMIDVNVRGLVHLTGRLLPTLRARGGTIMTIASTTAYQPTPFAATYGATKAFVLHWTIALNEELRGTGVTAIAVSPGPIDTNFFHAAGLGQGAVSPRLSMSADEVVALAMRAAGRRRSHLMTGWKNRAYAFVAARLSKVLAARIGAKFLAKSRLQRIKR
jgi:short-subunit dehydrogenase